MRSATQLLEKASSSKTPKTASRWKRNSENQYPGRPRWRPQRSRPAASRSPPPSTPPPASSTTPSTTSTASSARRNARPQLWPLRQPHQRRARRIGHRARMRRRCARLQLRAWPPPHRHQHRADRSPPQVVLAAAALIRRHLSMLDQGARARRSRSPLRRLQRPGRRPRRRRRSTSPAPS